MHRLHFIKSGTFCLLFLGGNTIIIVCKDYWTMLTVSTFKDLAPPSNFFLAPSMSLTVISTSITQLLLINCADTITIFCKKRIVGVVVHSGINQSHSNGFKSDLEKLTKVLKSWRGHYVSGTQYAV